MVNPETFMNHSQDKDKEKEFDKELKKYYEKK